MKKMILIGKSGSGKTTLLQRLQDTDIAYKKTQSVEVHGNIIDTPGEYMENKRLFRALIVTCVDASVALLLQDATDADSTFFAGMDAILAMPIIGVITKTDLADAEGVSRSRSFLELAGASSFVAVSATKNKGIEKLRCLIDDVLTGQSSFRGDVGIY